MSIADSSYDRVNDYSSVKISLAGRRTSALVVRRGQRSRRRSTTGPTAPRRTACSANGFSAREGLGVRLRQVPRHEVQGDDLRSLRREDHALARSPQADGAHRTGGPVVHIWFFKAMPSRLGNLLNMKTTSLEKVIYFQDYVVTNPGETDLELQQLLTEEEYRDARASTARALRSRHGCGGHPQAVDELDLVKLSEELREEMVRPIPSRSGRT
jgi:DNA-directed RNA polymerase subunit beta'